MILTGFTLIDNVNKAVNVCFGYSSRITHLPNLTAHFLLLFQAVFVRLQHIPL